MRTMNPERDSYFRVGEPPPPRTLREFHRHEHPIQGYQIGSGRYFPSMEYPLGSFPSWYRVPLERSYPGGPWSCDVCWSDWRWVG